MNYWWGYELVHQFLLTGKFTWTIPVLGKWLEWQYPGGKPPMDWFGVNYYSRQVQLVVWCENQLLPGALTASYCSCARIAFSGNCI